MEGLWYNERALATLIIDLAEVIQNGMGYRYCYRYSCSIDCLRFMCYAAFKAFFPVQVLLKRI